MATRKLAILVACGTAFLAGCKARTDSGSEVASIKSKANESAACQTEFAGFDASRGLLVTPKDLPAAVASRYSLPTLLANALGSNGKPAHDAALRTALKDWFTRWETGAYQPDDLWRDQQGPLVGLDFRPGAGLLPATGLLKALGLKEWDGNPSALPFKMVSVVNRLDLWNGERNDAGETRVIFGVPKQTFMVILEYRNPEVPELSQSAGHKACTEAAAASGNLAIKYWACRWQQIGTARDGAFDASLIALLDDVTGPAAAQASSMARGQIRTNDFVTVLGWELREFKIQSGLIKASTAKQTLSIGNLSSPPAQFLADVESNVMRIADGQAIDGFFPYRRALGEHISQGGSVSWDGIYDDNYRAIFEKALKQAGESDPLVECLAQGTSLPPAIQEAVQQGSNTKERFHLAAMNSVRLASCAGCHNHEALGTLKDEDDESSENFMHVDAAGNVSAFLMNELPIREEFLKKAVCDPNPQFVSTRCFEQSDGFPPRQQVQ